MNSTVQKLRTAGILFCLMTGAWLLIIFLPFLFPQNATLKIFFSIMKEPLHQICHQIPEKTFHDDIYTFPVCARCTGIYIGSFLGSLLGVFSGMRFLFSKKTILFWLALPMFLDVLTINFQIRHYSLWIACVTGIIFGFGIFPFILNALEKRKIQLYEQ